MKRIVTLVSMLFVALALSLASGQALAGKKAKPKGPKLTTVKGEVVKQAGKRGALKGIQIKGEDGKTYRVYMNKTGKKMVKQLAGKKAEVSAQLIRKGTKKKPVLWLNVRKFKVVAEAPAEAAEEDPAEE